MNKEVVSYALKYAAFFWFIIGLLKSINYRSQGSFRFEASTAITFAVISVVMLAISKYLIRNGDSQKQT